MGSTQVTLAPNTPSVVNIPNPCGRVVVTLMSGPTEVWMTADGTGPITPSNDAILSSSQVTLAGVVGAQAILQPRLPGSGATGQAGPPGSGNPQIQLMSTGAPVLELVW